jgi:hypothetical protein
MKTKSVIDKKQKDKMKDKKIEIKSKKIKK